VQRSTGLLLPVGQGGALIASTARLRAEISGSEVALHAMETFATAENPKVQVMQREIAAMRSQLNDLETQGGSGSNFEVSAGKLPQTTLGYIRKLRDVKYHEALFELLAKQYEAARLDESKQAPLIQVIDRANVPDKKSGPARLATILEFALLGFVLSCVYVGAVDRFRLLLSDQRQAENLAAVRSSIKLQTQK
jgi:tyrosine-protein kinase Etk/Wzc